MPQVSVGDREAGGGHRRGNFVTVPAVADKGINQAWTLRWLTIVAVLEQWRKSNLEVNIRMPVALRRKSMWLLLRLLSTSRHGRGQREVCWTWIHQQLPLSYALLRCEY